MLCETFLSSFPFFGQFQSGSRIQSAFFCFSTYLGTFFSSNDFRPLHFNAYLDYFTACKYFINENGGHVFMGL
ncbi:hypothetical protein V6Z11_D06G184200 [Gossypium hirsutum]